MECDADYVPYLVTRPKSCAVATRPDGSSDGAEAGPLEPEPADGRRVFDLLDRAFAGPLPEDPRSTEAERAIADAVVTPCPVRDDWSEVSDIDGRGDDAHEVSGNILRALEGGLTRFDDACLSDPTCFQEVEG